ncbi:uncharacterized protein cubi_03741 [Cryptosporidium ubiquitum]|uniref:RNB domain-containing protein n=1 Tax=Cryptosporidium ubiquitum TaxID=857276 RepID=A0A1J4MM58_9CRYT|nr:uncharacterized protein cubi_03741 [Cryptosporidium ubiquitum]OII75262.1 hypothetical protein cubi_03741 [Cryptosporidium ubiquitum]
MPNSNSSLTNSLRNNVKSAVYKGVIRVANPLERFVTVDDRVNGPFDIYIFGYRGLNGVIHGDTVLVKVTGVFQGRLIKRFKNKDSKILQQSKQNEQRSSFTVSDSTEVKNHLKYPNYVEETNSENNSDEENQDLHEDNLTYVTSQDEEDLDSFQEDKSTPTSQNIGSNKENVNNSNQSELLTNSNSHLKHPIPKYVGIIIKVVESVTKKAPIVGFILPISYFLKLNKEAKMKKKFKMSGKKPKIGEEFKIQNCFKTIGIDDNDSKMRTLLTSENIDIKKNEFCFVPIQRVYPIMKLFINDQTRNTFLKNNANEKNMMSCNLLFGAVIEINRVRKNRRLQLTKFYGSFNKFETIFSSLLDCFELSSHSKIYNQHHNSRINVSSSSKEWLKQSNRKTFEPSEYRVITIDPPTAKDLDDAIHIKFDEKLKIYEVGIHIADVYYYMLRHKGLLKTVTKELCTSVYLPHTNFPMLPRIFSSDLCSLLPNQKRPTLSLIIKINEEGEVLGEPEFFHGIITSVGKFSYDDVDELFEIFDQIDISKESTSKKLLNCCQSSKVIEIMKRSTVYKKNRKNVLRDLLLLRILTKTIRNSKARINSIKLFNVDPCFNFNSKFQRIIEPFNIVKSNNSFGSNKDDIIIPNIELKFDIFSNTPNSLKNIAPKRVTIYYKHSTSHSLIEELMLLANRVTAEFTVKNRPESSCIIRIHDEISNTKLYNLITYLRKHGFSNIFEDNIKRENIVNGLYRLYKDYGLLYYCAVSEMLRDIFSRAKYMVYNKDARDSNISTNHFALNMNMYTHFTSPIRRAADILVHQMIYDILDNISGSKNKGKGKSYDKYNQLIFSEDDHITICENSNTKSNASKNMQRDSNNIFFSQLIKKIDTFIPSIACIHKINAQKFKVNSVLLYPTDFYQVFLIDSKSFIKNSSLFSMFKLHPSLPIHITPKDNKIELHWKLHKGNLRTLSKKLNISGKLEIRTYLNVINDLMKNKFQHKLIFDQTNQLIIQTIGIWSYLPVNIVPTTTLPPKFVVIPMNPLNHHFYDQISNFN